MKYAVGLVIAIALAAWLFMRGGGGGSSDPVADNPVSNGSNRPTAVAPTLAGRRIAGTVERDGAPVAGAAVQLASAYGEEQRVSDATGRFDFGPQPPRAYLVSAQLPQVTGAVLAVDLRTDIAADALRLVLHACDAAIYGTVRDVAGGVVPNARVAHSLDSANSDLSTLTRDDGTYELCVPAGNSGMRVSADGYATLTNNLATFGRTRHDVELAPEAVLHGHVEPAISGAEVVMGLSRTTTDSDGKFQFAGVLPGRHDLTATADGLATDRPVGIVAKVGDNPEIVIPLSPAFLVEGKVIDDASHAVAGISIWLANDQGRHIGYSGADGAFAIPSVPQGDYKVLGEGHRLQLLAVDKDVHGLMLKVAPHVAVSGRVTRKHEPVEGASVMCGASTVTSDADGRYATTCAKGSQRLYAESHRVGAFSTKTVEISGARNDLDIELDLVGSIAGSVVDQNGAPVAGVLVECRLQTTGDFGASSTGSDGAFLARSMSGGGTYDCGVSRNDHSQRFMLVDGNPAVQVSLADGTSVVTGVRIAIRVEHLRIAGKVVDASGAAVPDMQIGAQSQNGNLTTYSDAAGGFGFHDVAQGSYIVSAQDGVAMVRDVAAGRTDVVLSLPATGTLEGTLLGFASPPRIQMISRRGGDNAMVSVTAGGFRAGPVSVGRYMLIATSREATARGEVEIVAGQVAHLELTAVATGRIEGTVRDAATHAPKPYSFCRASSNGSFAGGETDDNGAYAIAGVVGGKATVTCDVDRTDHTVDVVAGKTTHLDVDIQPPPKLGMVLEDRGDKVFVRSVEQGGRAAAAGVAADDRVVKANGRPARVPSQYLVQMLEGVLAYRGVDLELERAGKSFVVKVDSP